MPAPIHEISESEIKNKLSFNAKISSIKIKEGHYNKDELIKNILNKF